MYKVDLYREFWDVIKGENIFFAVDARKLKHARNYLIWGAKIKGIKVYKNYISIHFVGKTSRKNNIQTNTRQTMTRKG